jgi:hypothetical protein
MPTLWRVQPARADSHQNPAVLDSRVVDPSWPPPHNDRSGSEAPGRKTIPASLVYGSLFLVLVLLVVAVCGFGSFKRRTDLLRTVPVGTLLTTGPYEFRFSEATAQHKENYDGTFYWEVVLD